MTTATAVNAAPAHDAPLSAKQWFVLGVLCFTILLISLDQTVLNIALPTLVRDLHPSSSGLEWIVDSYTLTQAVLLVFSGALGDRFGRRRMFIIGSALFGGGSLGCALVHSTWPLVAMRVLTGLGAAGLMPATLAIIVATFEGHHRARAIGIWAGIGGIGGAAGPILGGLLLQHFWWGSVFLINVPIAVVAILGALFAITETRATNPNPIDPVGVVLSAGGLTALTYALIVAPNKHWASQVVLGSVAASLILLNAFFSWDTRREDPLIDLGLFRNAGFSAGIAAVTSMFFAMFSVSFLLSQYIQFIQKASVLSVGIRFAPMALGSLVASNLSSRVAHRFGLRNTVLAGMTMVIVGLGMFTTFVSTTSGFLLVGIAFACVGSGMGLSIAPASNAVVSVLPEAKVGVGSGLRSMVQWLGGSFGVAIVGSLATSHYRAEVNASYNGALSGVPPAQRAAISEQIGHAVLTARRLPAEVATKVTTVTDHAFVGGLRLATLIGLAVTASAAIAVGVFLPKDLEIDDEEVKLSSAAA
ncbi:MAG TPA: MFS transporter [Mycobacteriales bacterium]|nr:MFS transporter [Mycobacteriales bacterium]